MLDGLFALQTARKFIIIIGSRHPQRFAAVNELLVKQNMLVDSVLFRAQGEMPQVLLADQMALRALYSLARLTFCGG